MNIGITIPSLHVAGGIKCLLKVASGLRARGHKVTCYWRSYSTLNHLKSLFIPPIVRWTEEPHQVVPVLEWSDIPRHDALIASSWRTATPVCAWSQSTGGKGLYYIQHHEAMWDGGEEAAATYKLPLKQVVISSWLQTTMKQVYGQESTVLVTPVDEALFQEVNPRPDRPQRVLLLHHTFDWKGFPEGVAAIEEVRRTHPRLQPVVLAGRERPAGLPAGYEVHFQPGPKELRQLYAGCGIFLCSSWHEGLGMPAMEAMATGALLVTTDTGGSRDYAIQGQTAWVSLPRDPKGLARGLAQGLERWDELEPMRHKGQAKIREFQWGRNLDILESLLR
ncbi:MAG: glycosyltransferase family 4 protein [Planctomycetota bacterium]